jgi:ABC-type lipoprotein export system ATPase subunit
LLLADEPTGNLDSRTSEEVLRLFQQLNQEEHLTIILVTHDPAFARHAGRTVGIRDGVIIDESSAPPEPRTGGFADAAMAAGVGP